MDHVRAGAALSGLGRRTDALAAPVVTGLSTRNGVAAGGTTLKITGENLDSTGAVRFGRVRAPFLATPTQLTVTVPPNPAGGVVDVTVTTPDSGVTTGREPDRYRA
ncbi:IPT/TIG domain-containing protein [Actinoplanes sp. NPDC051861]|uniref:IPT/TIG domain-containing protein n=1 Tax=Actinoplanes sp. NPDC051861 TaxID=3155170 RepID=UPI0034326D36